MNLSDLLISVVSSTAAGILTISFAYYLVKPDLQKYFVSKDKQNRVEDHQQILTLRLQAHERMIVFIERINPANLFIRLNAPGLSIREFQAVILNDIRTEFQHNVTQQLYISSVTWNIIKKLKDDTMSMVTNAAAGLPEGVPALDLSMKVLQHMAGLENNPYDLTLDLIKEEIHQMF